MKRHFFGAVGALAIIALLVSCQSDPTSSLRGGVDRVVISRSYIELDVGETIRLNAKAYDEQGNVVGTLPEVSVSDPGIASVTIDTVTSGDPLPQTDFELTALGPGQIEVTATAGGVSSDPSTAVLFPLTFDGNVSVDASGLQDILTISSSATLTFDTNAEVWIDGVLALPLSMTTTELQVVVQNTSDASGATVTLNNLLFLGSTPVATLDAPATVDVKRSPFGPDLGSAVDITSSTLPQTFYVFVTHDVPDMIVKYAPAADLPLIIDVDWNTDADVDIYWLDTDGAIFACGGGCTGAKPEQSNHTVAGGDTEYLDINLYDGDDSIATVIISQ
jgi:hypothetical protein